MSLTTYSKKDTNHLEGSGFPFICHLHINVLMSIKKKKNLHTKNTGTSVGECGILVSSLTPMTCVFVSKKKGDTQHYRH